jgi:hypothetical protein
VAQGKLQEVLDACQQWRDLSEAAFDLHRSMMWWYLPEQLIGFIPPCGI